MCRPSGLVPRFAGFAPGPDGPGYFLPGLRPSGSAAWARRLGGARLQAMRFTIRDILLLTVIVAVATCWGLDRWRLVRRATQLEQQSQLMRYEAEMARAVAIMEQQRAVAQLERAAALQQAQNNAAQAGK